MVYEENESSIAAMHSRQSRRRAATSVERTTVSKARAGSRARTRAAGAYRHPRDRHRHAVVALGRVQCQRLFKGITHHNMPMASATMPATIAAARALTTSEITR